MTSELRDLIIYGAGAVDVVKLVHRINDYEPTWNLVGFLDDTPSLQGTSVFGYPVVGDRQRLDALVAEQHDFVNNVASTTDARASVTALLESRGCRFASLAHPDVDLEFTSIGRDVLISQGALIGSNAAISDHCVIRYRAIVNHDCVLGRNVFVGPGSTLCGHVSIAENTYIGAGSTVRERTSIGSGSVVGAGAVVVADIPDNVIVAGVPARILRPRENAEKGNI